MPLPSKQFWKDTQTIMQRWEADIRADERRRAVAKLKEPATIDAAIVAFGGTEKDEDEGRTTLEPSFLRAIKAIAKIMRRCK